MELPKKFPHDRKRLAGFKPTTAISGRKSVLLIWRKSWMRMSDKSAGQWWRWAKERQKEKEKEAIIK